MCANAACQRFSVENNKGMHMLCKLQACLTEYCLCAYMKCATNQVIHLLPKPPRDGYQDWSETMFCFDTNLPKYDGTTACQVQTFSSFG